MCFHRSLPSVPATVPTPTPPASGADQTGFFFSLFKQRTITTRKSFAYQHKCLIAGISPCIINAEWEGAALTDHDCFNSVFFPIQYSSFPTTMLPLR
jgi:hypothetical protein